MKFEPGQRATYTCPENPRNPKAPKFASMGNTPLVMHLNARDEHGTIKPITGTIRKFMWEDVGGEYYAFSPDGWQAPDEGTIVGFVTNEKELRLLKDDSLYLPGTITDRLGRPINE